MWLNQRFLANNPKSKLQPVQVNNYGRSKGFSTARYSSRTTVSDRGNPTFSHTASGTVAFDTKNRTLHTDNCSWVGKASLHLEPYLVVGSDDERSVLDSAGEQMKVDIYTNGIKQPVYRDGAIIKNLVTYEEYTVRIDAGNLDNPLWRIESDVYKIQVIPNVVNRLPIPIVAMGEVSGRVESTGNDPAVGGYVANSRDVTERYLRQEEIKNSLKEKETLLTEIHHRVKNNLAVISAMLQLQYMDVENQKVFDSLSDSVSRIRAIADIHEQMYQSKTFSRLDFTENIRQLATEIVNTFQVNTITQVTFACDQVELNVNQAIPCSLIINEVITNILKHAFSGKKHGMIHISLRVKDDKLKLSIKDNGTGFKGNIKEIKSGSLGLQIIAVLSQQLEAEYDYSTTEEFNSFTLKFVKGDIKGSASLFA